MSSLRGTPLWIENRYAVEVHEHRMAYDETTQVTKRHLALSAAATKQEEVRLVMLAGPFAGDKFDIGQELIIGRASSCRVCINDSLVSRKHARIYPNGDGAFVIEDLGSRNGVQVNGRLVNKQKLSYGDRIQIAGLSLIHI